MTKKNLCPQASQKDKSKQHTEPVISQRFAPQEIRRPQRIPFQISSLRSSNLCGVTSSGNLGSARSACRDGGPIHCGFECLSDSCSLISVPQLRQGDAFAGMRKRLVQQRFERVGYPTAINGPHRDFQDPSHARQATLGDLVAEQGFDRGGKSGSHGTIVFLRLRWASSSCPASSCA